MWGRVGVEEDILGNLSYPIYSPTELGCEGLLPLHLSEHPLLSSKQSQTCLPDRNPSPDWPSLGHMTTLIQLAVGNCHVILLYSHPFGELQVEGYRLAFDRF